MDTYTVEFRIEGSNLVPLEITNILELSPSLTSDMIINVKKKVKHTPFWSYDGISSENNFVEKKWDSLEEGLLFLIKELSPKFDLIKSNFTEYKTYWWCGHFQESFNGGPRLSPTLLKKLADLNTELIISNYCS